MAYNNSYNAGTEQATLNVVADGLAIAQNDSRAVLIVQNRGTASCGLSFQSTAPVAQANCSILLAPATADGNGDGDLVILNHSKEALGVKFAAAGTKNLSVTAVV